MSVDRLAEAPDQRPQSTRSNPLPRSSTLTHPPLPNNLSEAHAQHTIGSDMGEDEAEAGSILIALANQSGHTKPAPGTSSELGKDLHHHHHQTSKRETENTMRRSSMSIRSLIDVGTTWPPDPPMALDKQQRDADQEARWGSLAAASHRTDQSDGYRDPSDARYQNIHQHAYEHGAHYAVGTSTGNSHHPSEYFHGQKTNFQGVPQTLRPSHPSESSRAPHPTNPPGYQSRQGWTLPRKSENAASGKNPVDVRQHRLLLTPKIRRNALHAYISYLIYADIAAVNKRQRSKYDHSTSVFKSIDRGQSVLQAKAPPLPLPSHPGTQYQQQRQGPHPAQAGVARSYSTPMYSSAPSTIRPVTSSSSYLQPVQPNYYYSAGPESTTAAALPFAPPPPTSSCNRETPVAYYPNEIPNHRHRTEDGHPQQQRRPEGNIIHRPLTAFLHDDESQSERK